MKTETETKKYEMTFHRSEAKVNEYRTEKRYVTKKQNPPAHPRPTPVGLRAFQDHQEQVRLES